jgi:hypothetical protein
MCGRDRIDTPGTWTRRGNARGSAAVTEGRRGARGPRVSLMRSRRCGVSRETSSSRLPARGGRGEIWPRQTRSSRERRGANVGDPRSPTMEGSGRGPGRRADAEPRSEPGYAHSRRELVPSPPRPRHVTAFPQREPCVDRHPSPHRSRTPDPTRRNRHRRRRAVSCRRDAGFGRRPERAVRLRA